MDKMYSVVTLRMNVFFSLSNNVLPYNRVWDKENLVNSSNLVDCSLLNEGQWRRKCEVNSISKPQLQIQFKQT